MGAVKEGVPPNHHNLPSLVSVRDPHLCLPLWPRRPGCTGPVFPKRSVHRHLPGLPPHAQPTSAPHPPTGPTAEEVGPTRPPLLFHSEDALHFPQGMGSGAVWDWRGMRHLLPVETPPFSNSATDTPEFALLRHTAARTRGHREGRGRTTLTVCEQNQAQVDAQSPAELDCEV